MMTVKRKPKKQGLSNSYSVVKYNVMAEKMLCDHAPTTYLKLLTGTLVNVNVTLDETFVAIKIVNLEKQYHVSEEDIWKCERDALIHVDKSVWPILSAIPSPIDRVVLLRDSVLLDELAAVKVGSVVNILKDGYENEYLPAVVKYKGPISKKGPGVYFGVEILEGVLEGDNDGCYGNQRFFSSPPGTGMFVSVERLLPANYSMRQNSNDSVQQSKLVASMQKQFYPVSPSICETICECEKNELKIGDRVIWMCDNEPISGIVRWIGFSESNQLKVSIQFDEPVHVEYVGGHDSRTITVPAVELVKASDFYGDEGESKSNGEVSWNSGATSTREINTKYNQATQDFITLNTPPSSSYDDGASSGSEGSGYYDTPDSSSAESFSVGSVVEVPINGEPNYGVIRWIGTVPGDKKSRRIAGIEMEKEHPGFGDGSFNGRRYFHCNPERSLFISLSQCKRDSRFQDSPFKRTPRKSEDFGCIESPIIPGFIPPISRGDITSICGKNRGIQGHHNSCYLDATLFSMFTFTSVFDSILYRPALCSDIPHYQLIQRVLRDEIVNPLRTNFYVRADRVMKLRTLMKEELKDVSFTTEEKDPEEFLTSLVAKILRAEPFLKLSSGQEAYHYQLFVEKDEALVFPTVQQLFEQSFLSSDLKLKEVPSCLIIQMPRFGKSFKMYPRILPSQLLDVTDVIEDSPRQCTVCGNLADFECKECFEQCDVGLQSISFCRACLERSHNHERRRNHKYKPLSVPLEFTIIKDHCLIPRLYMQLFAVVCIETSHYVTFVKCGTGADAPWCFFDSMADRKGEQNGYNIPEMVACPELPYWLSEKGAMDLQSKDERRLPEYAKRLLCDAYMCMYQSTEVMMYR
ncbi:ubiquitin carboxyl-terminal hydrolase CYLD isoform X2 [Halyomorpha halys]|uniref:ubiquitin carboxyl-terminal hydrolase CYLD isoform X2 n=1 Tax=Halyomorpha halys TaxID=286706 RepID=UPI0006D4D595|nr:ubiquitin carboxyl-terminal hydrolase CYLD isoform X2 [Halyomorpha halys]